MKEREGYYYEFPLVNYNKNKNESEFKSDYGENPFIRGNTLYISLNLLNEKFLSNRHIKKFQNNNDNLTPKDFNSDENDEINKLKNMEPTGLINIGGICYLNAVLQCFYYCKPLTNYFLKLNKNKLNLGPLSKGYYDLVQGLSKGDIRAASNFKSAMIKIDDTFIGNDGKDSKDVAILLLCEMNEELNKNENSIQNFEKNLNHYIFENIYESKLKYEEYNKTIISETFGFFIKYEQKCNNNCKKYHKNYYTIEVENIIIFELEKIYNDLNYGKKTNNYKQQPVISLKDCLTYFISSEKIKCPSCNNKIYLTIKKSICKLPNIFIFVLSRGYNVKFDCKILYEIDLDMNDYYEPLNIKNNNNNTKYKLIGATFSYDWTKGIKHTGHTVAFCKTYKEKNNNPQYYIFNDSKTIQSNENRIKNEIPYLLFYEKIN